MNKYDRYVTVPMCVACVLACIAMVASLHFDRVAQAQVTGDAQNALMGSTDEYARLQPTMLPHPNGGYATWSNPAAYDWHPGTDIPERPDGDLDPLTNKRIGKWPISIIPVVGYPDTVYYWDGWFRMANGQRVATPKRWAYWRLEPEVWNPTTKSFDIPGLTAPATVPTPPDTDKPGVHMDDFQGQAMVDDLKRSFTWEKIMTFGDLSPYDEPDTGAPEDGPGAP